eukprot:COSAG04_NODE_34716_length_104_cov_106.800000_1_plen_21_part_01
MGAGQGSRLGLVLLAQRLVRG